MMWERGPKCKRTFLELGDTPTPRNKFIKFNHHLSHPKVYK